MVSPYVVGPNSHQPALPAFRDDGNCSPTASERAGVSMPSEQKSAQPFWSFKLHNLLVGLN